MGSERTVREVVDLIVELGLIDPDTLTRLTFVARSLDEPLTYYGHTEQSAVRNLLGELNIRYTFDYKTFRGLVDCTDEERLEWYESELESIAACSRGWVVITNVRLIENGTDWEVRFDCNGTTESWPVHPGDDEDVETALVFATYITELHTGVVERFCHVDPPDKDLSGEAFFGDPVALNRLGAHFGLAFGP
ncbi:hypothetical protein [Nocardia abscessus]|uniref:Uncharacterized protein n=1 Tax=Nocardia abscessus TaxID=120957 RepID=A0ABS0CC23_9NOCA|nr:hypothetical protein [Nocardia abscessus]MBF6227905.1 hypothetical protein [Nocardia abscessus]